jgi:hypothetical protein
MISPRATSSALKPPSPLGPAPVTGGDGTDVAATFAAVVGEVSAVVGEISTLGEADGFVGDCVGDCLGECLGDSVGEWVGECVGRWLGDGVLQANALVELSTPAVTAASTTIVAFICINSSSSLLSVPGPATLGVRTPFRQWLNFPIPARLAEGGPGGVTRPGHCETRAASRLTPPRQWLHQLAPRRTGTPPLDTWTLLQGSVPGNSSGKDPPGSRRQRPRHPSASRFWRSAPSAGMTSGLSRGLDGKRAVHLECAASHCPRHHALAGGVDTMASGREPLRMYLLAHTLRDWMPGTSGCVPSVLTTILPVPSRRCPVPQPWVWVLQRSPWSTITLSRRSSHRRHGDSSDPKRRRPAAGGTTGLLFSDQSYSAGRVAGGPRPGQIDSLASSSTPVGVALIGLLCWC